MKKSGFRLCLLGFSLGSLILGGCASSKVRDQVRSGIRDLYSESYSDSQTIEVLYATNRQPLVEEGGCGDGVYGVTPVLSPSTVREIRYGICVMNVPKKRAVGEIRSIAPGYNDPLVDPHQNYKAISHQKLSLDDFKSQLLKNNQMGVLVFVHGFNVKYEEAILRASQLAYDLKFQGRILLISWPAGAGSSLLDSTLINRTYESNKQYAADSIPMMVDLMKILYQVSEEGVAVSLLVHSMGHQVVLPALAQFNQDKSGVFLQELILNAPDFPVEDYEKIASSISNVAQRITIYCSVNDNAMVASKTINKVKRLGACAMVSGADVVNVSDIDAPTLGIGGLGHGYYSGRAIITDVFQLMLGVKAESRLFIRKAEANGNEHYFLRP